MNMSIDHLSSDATILSELGLRLAHLRVQRNLTQAHLAKQAGISKPTLERIEAGRDAQLSTMIRLLRALDLLDALHLVIPPISVSPMSKLKTKGHIKKRASSPRKGSDITQTWSWQDDS